MPDVNRSMILEIKEKGGQLVVSQLDKIDKAQQKVANSAKKTTTAQNDQASAADKMRAVSNRSNQALLQTGRIVQDLPFGFMGIANNIPIAVESFQYLGNEMEAQGVKMSKTKLIMQALAGPAGIGFIVSAATTLILMWPKIKDWFGGLSEEAKKAADEGLKKLEERLRNISGLQLRIQIGDIKKDIAEAEKTIAELTGGKKLITVQTKMGDVVKEVTRTLTVEEGKRLAAARKVLDEKTKELKLAEGVDDELGRSYKQLTGIIEKQKAHVDHLTKQLETAKDFNEIQRIRLQLLGEEARLSSMQRG